MRDYKKFFTPQDVGTYMVSLLNPEADDIILEPHAGNGALCKAVKKICPKCTMWAVENDRRMEGELYLSSYTDIVIMRDFLQFKSSTIFNKCIANPPFGHDIDLQAHFDKIRSHVVTGGNIVMVVPEDFKPKGVEVNEQPIKNWSENSDGTTTKIKVIQFFN